MRVDGGPLDGAPPYTTSLLPNYGIYCNSASTRSGKAKKAAHDGGAQRECLIMKSPLLAVLEHPEVVRKHDPCAGTDGQRQCAEAGLKARHQSHASEKHRYQGQCQENFAEGQVLGAGDGDGRLPFINALNGLGEEKHAQQYPPKQRGQAKNE